jgi:hypothetical protein
VNKVRKGEGTQPLSVSLPELLEHVQPPSAPPETFFLLIFYFQFSFHKGITLKVVVEWLAFFLLIREFLGSNLDSETCYTDWDFSWWYSLVILRISCTSSSEKPRFQWHIGIVLADWSRLTPHRRRQTGEVNHRKVVQLYRCYQRKKPTTLPLSTTNTKHTHTHTHCPGM